MRQGLHVALCLYFFMVQGLLTSCGQDETTSDASESMLASDPTAFTPALYAPVKHYMDTTAQKIAEGQAVSGTIVFAGGFHSCYSSNVQIMEAGLPFLWRMAAKGRYYHIVVSCFRNTPNLAYYFSSSAPNKVMEGSHDDFVGAVAKEARRLGNRQTVLIGHSFGGWLSMRTALKLPPAINVKGVVTLDPISPVYCHPSVFIGSYVSSLFSVKPHPDCNRAPRDIADADRDYIKKRSSWWLNYYQDNSIFLHSTPIPQAKNAFLDFDYTGYTQMAFAHADVAIKPSVWTQIEENF